MKILMTGRMLPAVTTTIWRSSRTSATGPPYGAAQTLAKNSEKGITHHHPPALSRRAGWGWVCWAGCARATMLGPGAPSGLQVDVLPHHLIQQLAGKEGIAAHLPITHCTHACTKTSRACNRHGRICSLQLVAAARPGVCCCGSPIPAACVPALERNTARLEMPTVILPCVCAQAPRRAVVALNQCLDMPHAISDSTKHRATGVWLCVDQLLTNVHS